MWSTGTHRKIATATWAVSCLVCVSLAGSCSSAIRPGSDAGTDADQGCDACGDGDGDVHIDADHADSDAAPTEVELRGWRLEVDGQRLFFPQDAIDEEALVDLCRTGLTGLPTERAYWVEASQPEGLLALFPSADPAEGAAGLVQIEGLLSPSGQYGPDGAYQFALEVFDEELLLCPTVSVLGHCAVPHPDTRDACLFGRDPEIWGDGPWTLADLFSFQVGNIVVVEAEVMQTIDVGGDGNFLALIELDIESPLWIGSGPDESHEVFELPDFNVRTFDEVHRHPSEGVTFEASFTENQEGWLMRRRTVGDDSLSPEFFLSLSAASLDGEAIHLWASYPAMSTGGG